MSVPLIYEVPGGRRRAQSAPRESRRTRDASPLVTLSSPLMGSELTGVGRRKQELFAACITPCPPRRVLDMQRVRAKTFQGW